MRISTTFQRAICVTNCIYLTYNGTVVIMNIKSLAIAAACHLVLAATVSAGTASVDPLTVYDQPSLKGTSATIPETHTIYIDGSIPGGMNDKISSFRLEQGYMAVLSTDSDGMGLGKTFIASDAPLTVDALPANLDNAVSWIRVMPWRQTLKKGLGSTDSKTPGVVNTAWYYHWGVSPPHGNQEDHKWGEYVPMPRKLESHPPTAFWVERIVDMKYPTHVFVYNEVDSKDDEKVPLVLERFSPFQKTGLRLGSPSGREQAARFEDSFTPKFMRECDARGIRVDLTCMHWYDRNKKSVDDPERIFTRFKNYLSRAYHYCGRRPLAITEFNCGPPRSREIQDAFLKRALPYLEACGYVERYAWFQPRGGNGDFFDKDGKITSTGLIYKNHVSTPAYVPNRMPAGMNSYDVGASEQSGQVIHANGTFTVSGKGAAFDGTADECQFAYTPITGDCAITARLFDMIALEESNARAGIMIRDNLDANSSLAAMLMTWEGARFQYRTKAGAPSDHVSDTKISAPMWLRVVRSGDTLSGYTSADGNTWSLLSSQTVTMDSKVFLGMAVSQQDPKNGYFSDAIFTDLKID